MAGTRRPSEITPASPRLSAAVANATKRPSIEIEGERRFPLVTKAGAFGDSGSLVRALGKLRMIRNTGMLP